MTKYITVFPRKDAAATIYFSSTAMRRVFEGSYYSKFRRCGHYIFQRYRNAVTIRGRLLFEVWHLSEVIWYLKFVVQLVTDCSRKMGRDDVCAWFVFLLIDTTVPTSGTILLVS